VLEQAVVRVSCPEEVEELVAVVVGRGGMAVDFGAPECGMGAGNEFVDEKQGWGWRATGGRYVLLHHSL